MMKKILLIAFLVPFLTMAQNKKKGKKQQKTESVTQEVKPQISNVSNDQKYLLRIAELEVEYNEIKALLSTVNKQFLVNTFNNFYDDQYLKTQGFKVLEEKDFRIYNNADLIAKVILQVEEPNSEIINRAKASIIFKEYVETLDEVYKVLNKKYNEKEVNNAITKLEKLPPFDSTSRITIDKNTFINALKNYREYSCNATIVIQKIHTSVNQKKNFELKSLKSSEFDKILNQQKGNEAEIKFNKVLKEEKDLYPFLAKEIESIKKNPLTFRDNSLIDENCNSVTEMEKENIVDEVITTSVNE